MRTAMIQPLILGLVCVTALAQVETRPGMGPEQRFQLLDKDKDGKVTREEAGGAAWFDRLDRDGDGVVTLDELPARRSRPAGESAMTPQAMTRANVPYGEHSAQRLDVYSPKAATKAPVMVFVHGGGWKRGDKSGNTVPKKAAFFTGRGWVLVSINYRLLPDGKHPHNVQDVARAIAWVHDHIADSGGDPGKLFLMGHSAGAHLVSLVATDERRLEAFGKPLSIVRGVIVLDTNAYDLSHASRFHQQVFTDDPAVWRDASPITHISKGNGIPPFLICYSRGLGASPNPVRPVQAKDFADALRKSGIEADVVDASDRNHGEINQRFGDPDDAKVTGRAVTFLDTILASTITSPAEEARPRFSFEKDYFPGTVDATGKPLAGTEVMNFAVHNGKLYAGLGNRNLPDDAPIKVGAQIILKGDARSAWRVDHQFAQTAPRVNAMISATFTTDGAGHALGRSVSLLVAAPSDAAPTDGAEPDAEPLRWGTAWTRDDATGRWAETRVYSADRRKPACRSFGTYRDSVTGVSHLFAGTSHGSIHRAVYDASAPGRLVWNKEPELKNVGRVVGFAECKGVLYASCGLRRTHEGITGGLYRRVNGPRPHWDCVYRWPWPERRGGADEALLMRGLTAVPVLDGDGEVLLGSRAQPGAIERIDPRNDYAVTADLDLRVHVAALWGLASYKRAALSAYNAMIPWTRPDTGEAVHLIGVAVLHPTLSDTPPHNGSWFLLRDAAGTYSTSYIYDPAHPVPAGTNLRGTRAMQPSPFGDGAIFVGGGDIGKRTSLNTAWIYRGKLRAD